MVRSVPEAQSGGARVGRSEGGRRGRGRVGVRVPGGARAARGGELAGLRAQRGDPGVDRVPRAQLRRHLLLLRAASPCLDRAEQTVHLLH